MEREVLKHGGQCSHMNTICLGRVSAILIVWVEYICDGFEDTTARLLEGRIMILARDIALGHWTVWHSAFLYCSFTCFVFQDAFPVHGKTLCTPFVLQHDDLARGLVGQRIRGKRGWLWSDKNSEHRILGLSGCFWGWARQIKNRCLGEQVAC